MAQLSRFKLDRKTQNEILENFFKSFSDLRTNDQVQLFIDDLLTRTEKIMLSKRLAIAVLLHSGTSYQEIKTTLKVSGATIASVNNSLNQGSGYTLVISKLIKNSSKEGWFKTLLHSKTNMKSRSKLARGQIQ